MKLKTRGIFLITTLILVMFLIILGATMMASTLADTAMSSGFAEREEAYEAALAGVSYVQAQLENNQSKYAPTGAFFTSTVTLTNSTDGSLEVTETNGNVVGVLHSVIPGETHDVSLVFRACFNSFYKGAGGFGGATRAGALSIASTGGNFTLPPIHYISINNLLSDVPDQSYTSTGTVHRVVPNCGVDLVVSGYAIRSDGLIRSTRTAEVTLSTSGLSGVAAQPTFTQLDTNVAETIPASAGGQISVGVDGHTLLNPSQTLTSMTSMQNVSLYGPDSPGANPPGYTSKGSANVGNLANFSYQQAGGAKQNYIAMNNPQPPAPSALSLRGSLNNAQIQGGTWALWNGQFYHYPTNYSVYDSSGNLQPPGVVSATSWSTDPGNVNGAPFYNSTPYDVGPVRDPFQGDPGMVYHQIDVATNTITVKGDVNVVAGGGGGGPGGGRGGHGHHGNPGNTPGGAYDPNSLALVVAPANIPGSQTIVTSVTTIDPTTGLPVTTSVTSTVTGAANNSQAAGITLNLQPGTATASAPQITGSGNITVIGTVTGNGALVTTNPATGDITLQGTTTTSPAPDRGIALMAAANINMLPIDLGQPTSGNTIAAATLINTQLGAALTTALAGQLTVDPAQFTPLIKTVLTTNVGGTPLNVLLSAFSPADQYNLVRQYITAVSSVNGSMLQIDPTKIATGVTLALGQDDQRFGGLLDAGGDVIIPKASKILIDGAIVANGELEADAQQATFLYGGNVLGGMAQLFGNHVQLSRTMVSSL